MADDERAAMRRLVDLAPAGLVVIGGSGEVRFRNERAVEFLGDGALPKAVAALLDDALDREASTVVLGQGSGRRELRCRTASVSGTGPDRRRAMWLTDVTRVGVVQRRLAAIAAVSSTVADMGDLAATLNGIAGAVVGADDIAAAQIITFDEGRDRVRLLGTAGFRDTSGFAALLHACQQRGADLKMLTAAHRGTVVAVPHRKPVIMADPAWEPLHGIMDQPDWDSFAAVPMFAAGRTVGVLNVFYASHSDPPGEEQLVFLGAMAEQAALALHRAELVGAAELQAREEERRRMAADLHDSVVQQVFSIAMHTEALRAGGARMDSEELARRADDLADLARSALADLRNLVFELRPTGLGEQGLVDAVRGWAGSVSARTGLVVEVRTDLGFVGLPATVEDDVYRIIQEALANVAKHAEARRVTIEIALHGADHDRLVIDLVDDGIGFPATPRSAASVGLGSIRERALRHGGTVVMRSPGGHGGHVRVTIPLSPTSKSDESVAEEQ